MCFTSGLILVPSMVNHFSNSANQVFVSASTYSLDGNIRPAIHIFRFGNGKQSYNYCVCKSNSWSFEVAHEGVQEDVKKYFFLTACRHLTLTVWLNYSNLTFPGGCFVLFEILHENYTMSIQNP